MSGIELLVPDVLQEIMFNLPPTIEQKITIAQVSRFWRDVAIHSHLFWASFTAGHSDTDVYRVPYVMERSGHGTMLHIQLWFTRNVTGPPAAVLKALVPYVTRIETLDVKFNTTVDVKALLNSNLEFPALQTLCMWGPKFGRSDRMLPLWLMAPQLRTLDIGRVHLKNWDTLLVPSLENISLTKAGDSNVATLSNIFKRCPAAWRIVLYSGDLYSDEEFEVSSSRPLAPALRELTLELEKSDLIRVFKTGFSDVVLHSLTGCVGSVDDDDGECDLELTGALLRGVGPLTVFDLSFIRSFELRDEDGHIRRLEITEHWNRERKLEVQKLWKHLSVHYDLHQTVREIRICPAYWDECVEIFQSSYHPLQDGITLGLETDGPWGSLFPQLADEEDNAWDLPKLTRVETIKTIRLSGLAKVEFRGSYRKVGMEDIYWQVRGEFCFNRKLLVKDILVALAHIEPPQGRKVEVCFGAETFLSTGDQDGDALIALQTALQGTPWVICGHCVGNDCLHNSI